MRHILLFGLLTLIGSVALAGTNRWTTSGPEGLFVSKIEVDPLQPDVIYVQTPAGVYRTSDGGGNWLSVNEGLPSAASTFVAAGEPVTLYAAVNDTIWASEDRGEHWSHHGSLGNRFVITQLAYDEKHSVLYATAGGDLFLSRDGGASWTSPQFASLTGGADYQITVSATSVYAVRNLSSIVVMRSMDGGYSWTILSNVPTASLFASQESSRVYGVIVTTIEVSDDDGRSWTKLPSLPEAIVSSVVSPSRDLYSATGRGVFVYNESSRSWTQMSNITQINELAVVSSPSLRIYAAARSGLFELVDGDQVPRTRGLPGVPALDVAISDGDPSAVYLSTWAGVFRSDDAGQSWNQLTLPVEAEIVASSATADVVYAAAASPATSPFYGGVVKSSDRGLTWKNVSPSLVRHIAIAPSDGQTLYAALASGLVKTTDGGSDWTPITSGLPPGYIAYGYYYGAPVSALAVNPSDPANACVGIATGGVFDTDDGGAHWRVLSTGGFAGVIAIDSQSQIYAANQGIFKWSFDGTSLSSVGLIDKRVSALEASGTRLYAGTLDGHVYFTDDGGQFWNGLDDGLSFGSISRVVADASGQHLYAATLAGTFQLDLVDPDVHPERLQVALPRSFDDYLKARAFVIPVVGKVYGASALFTTDITLTSHRDTPQQVVVAWLPESGEGPAIFRATLPPGDAKLLDFNDRFGVEGIGSLAVFAVDDAGQPDGDAQIDGSARIWSHPSDGRAPFSQPIPAAKSALLDPHAEARIAAVTQDSRTRINVGIANLSGEDQRFTIQINGANGSGLIMFEVPALSLVQVPLPESGFGPMTLDAFCDSSNVRWLFYASAIDRGTGQAVMLLGTPAD